MIGYVTIGTNDIAAARQFYDSLLGMIGASRIMEFGEELGGFTMYGRSMTEPGFVITHPFDGAAATQGNGNMVAVQLDSRALVDAVHARALELGGSCEGPPGLRGEEGDMAFYAAYFRDPEGNKLAAFKYGPAD
ncbi:VOC family protein [Sphingobium algorifonticola]|uniref:VOC family protein n=1 Tax=Sphingobium algorifonticola TaxID=2008318 RepID=A0A437JBE0_9SPHN|nr:VOC family protein [Sphingobium algorifonticola]RVT43236.1 VOC family protein [Sphingobium algorifonticola]